MIITFILDFSHCSQFINIESLWQGSSSNFAYKYGRYKKPKKRILNHIKVSVNHNKLLFKKNNRYESQKMIGKKKISA